MLYRKNKHWSQTDLGKAAGISRNYVSMIERDDANVTIGTLEAVCAALGISVSIVLGGSESHLTPHAADSSKAQLSEASRISILARGYVVEAHRRR